MVILVFFLVISVNSRLFRYFGSYSGISVIPVILVNRRTRFSEIIRLDISCESSARHMIHMKYHALFSSKDKSKKIKFHLLQFLYGPLRVNWI